MSTPFLVQSCKGLIMIVGIVNSAGIGKYQPFCAPLGAIQCINITFVICIAAGEQAFLVIKTVTTDAFAVFIQAAGLSIHIVSLIFSDEVLRQSAVQVNIQRYIIFRCVAAVGV